MTIRQAKKEDLINLVSIRERIHSLKDEDLKLYLKDKNRILLVIEENDKPIGFACFIKEYDVAELDYIAISKEEEGKGYATKLLLEAEKELKNTGVMTIFLEVRASNSRAINTYEKNGYTVYRTRKNYYLNPIEDAICYRKDTAI